MGSNLRRFKTDFHIHTCLSPCADWEMSPVNIIKKCVEEEIGIIAVCDHNSSENSKAVIEKGLEFGVKVFPGMEICTKEEVHLLAIFENLDSAYAMQEFVYSSLSGKNSPELFGYQIVANSKDEVESENEIFLLGAVDKNIWKITEKIHQLNGIAIPAHIDRMAYSLISQLGFVPEDLNFDALEITGIPERNISSGNKPTSYVKSSDAHFIKNIGRRYTIFSIAQRTMDEIKLALKGEHSRGVILS